jgi:MFS family permease
VLLIAGSSLEILGLFMLSLSKEYYQLFLSQAICCGLGAGIVFTPSVAAAASIFTNPATRAKIMGLVAAMSSIGMRLARNRHIAHHIANTADRWYYLPDHVPLPAS